MSIHSLAPGTERRHGAVPRLTFLLARLRFSSRAHEASADRSLPVAPPWRSNVTRKRCCVFHPRTLHGPVLRLPSRCRLRWALGRRCLSGGVPVVDAVGRGVGMDAEEQSSAMSCPCSENSHRCVTFVCPVFMNLQSCVM